MHICLHHGFPLALSQRSNKRSLLRSMHIERQYFNRSSTMKILIDILKNVLLLECKPTLDVIV